MAKKTDDLWLKADNYIERLFTPPDAALAQNLKDCEQAGLPPINVSANEGKLLYVLARISGAKRMLEIGLLGGYSATWLARALPDKGTLISLEIDDHCAKVARKNLDRAGVGKKVEIRVGPALESLDAMIAKKESSFDLVFIDADKVNYPKYLERAMKLVHAGSLILADNVLRNGAVMAPGSDVAAKATNEFNNLLARDHRLEAIALPILRDTLDGLAIARVK